MTGPPRGALEEVRRLAGPTAAVRSVVSLPGGQHAETWKVDTEHPELTVVVRQFPAGDAAAAHEERVLRALDGLHGLAPLLLGSDVHGRWSGAPTTLIGWLDGRPDITPSDPERWASELARALATVHAVLGDRLADLPSVFERRGGSQESLAGPLAPSVRSRWAQITAEELALTHYDYWSGNTVFRDGKLTGIVDWSGAARGPRGYDVSWCRLDLVLLFDERLADAFLAAYEARTGRAFEDIALWDAWALARSHGTVETWTPNYAPFGRPDLTPEELRRRHSRWTGCIGIRLRADARG